jgi:diadenosine tetraphosphate (Ap4A) HIT family hydrolase
MQPSQPCVFCTSPENKEREIIRNELAWAFPTNIPIVPGHILICPIRCVATFDELTLEERGAIFELLAKIKQSLITTFAAEGFNYAWNENKIGGQSVPHFHLHVLPRKTGDTGIYEYEPRQFIYRSSGDRPLSPQEELVAVSTLIKNNIQ